jgi:putative ABC transport system permease protein
MKTFGWTLLTLLSHWRRHPVQLASLLLGLWLATALWSGVQSLNQQARQSYDQAAGLFSQTQLSSLQAPGGEFFDQAIWLQLRQQGWPLVPLLQGNMRLESIDTRLQLLGVDPLSQQQLQGTVSQVAGFSNLTDFITAPGQTLIAPATLQQFSWQVGDRPLTETGYRLPPLVTAEGLAPGTLVMDLGWAQQALDSPRQLNRMLAPTDWLAKYSGGPPLLPEELADKLIWQSGEEEADLARLTESFHLNLAALGLLSFAVGLFIVHATLGLALEQRQGMLRTLRASGITLGSLLLALAVELGTLALLGGLAGLISGYWLAAALLPDVAASLQSLYGARIAGHLQLQPQTWLTGLGMSFGGMLLAGGSWLYKASRLPLLSLARPQAWYQAESRRLKRQGLLALVALLVAGVAYLWGDSLNWGFLLLGSLLLAAALFLPLFLQLCLLLGNRLARHPVHQWFWADTRQQLPGLSLALMALLLAQAANIGVGTMTEGFRQTFMGWLDQRLAAEIYLRPESSQQALELQTWLEKDSRIEAILPSYQTRTSLEGWPLEISGLADHATYRDHWPLLEQLSQPWDQLYAQRNWLISEQLAYRLELQPGDQLTLNTPQGKVTQKVAGIYPDYGNPLGQLLMSQKQFQQLWPQQPVTSYALRLPPKLTEELVAELREVFALDSSRILDQASLKNWSAEVFNRTFTATGALSTLTLGLAALALFASLLTLSQARLPQLAPLWAVGLSPAHLAGLNLLQLLLLALLTALLAIPLGLLLAWCLVAVVNVQAFGWRLPLHFFPGLIFFSVFLALVSAFLAAAWPSWQLRKQAAGRLLKVFAHAG